MNNGELTRLLDNYSPGVRVVIEDVDDKQDPDDDQGFGVWSEINSVSDAEDGNRRPVIVLRVHR